MDFVLAAIARRAVRHFFHGVGAADRFDDLFLGAVVAVAVIAVVVVFGVGMLAVAVFAGFGRDIGYLAGGRLKLRLDEGAPAGKGKVVWIGDVMDWEAEIAVYGFFGAKVRTS